MVDFTMVGEAVTVANRLQAIRINESRSAQTTMHVSTHGQDGTEHLEGPQAITRTSIQER